MSTLQTLSQMPWKRFVKIVWRIMGRTVIPFSFVLVKEHGRWKEFRKSLSKEDREAFDRLFGRAQFHTSFAVHMVHPWPLETILLSIYLEQEKCLAKSWVSSRKGKGWVNNWVRFSFRTRRAGNHFVKREGLDTGFLAAHPQGGDESDDHLVSRV
jgi:hypothetical protein